MRVVILYHPNSEHGRTILDYVRDWTKFKGPQKKIELISLETREGSEMARLYSVTNYPAMLVLADDGRVQQLWQSGTMPLMNELDAYFHN